MRPAGGARLLAAALAMHALAAGGCGGGAGASAGASTSTSTNNDGVVYGKNANNVNANNASVNANVGAVNVSANGGPRDDGNLHGTSSTPVPDPDEPVVPDPSEMPPPQHLDAVDLVVGIRRLQAEVARTDAERQRGLMSRRDLEGGDRGMLFVFPRQKVLHFWMKNTPTPLSIAFLEEDGTIIEIDDMRPFDLDGTVSIRASRRALEMPQGWFSKNGVKPGDRIFGLDRAGDSLD